MTVYLYELARALNTQEYRVFSKLPRVFGWPDNIRRDSWVKTIIFEHYGNRHFPTGWEIDHIISKDKGGSEDLNNSQALQWENNVFKSNGTVFQTIAKLARQSTNSTTPQSIQPNYDNNSFWYNYLYGQK